MRNPEERHQPESSPLRLHPPDTFQRLLVQGLEISRLGVGSLFQLHDRIALLQRLDVQCRDEETIHNESDIGRSRDC